MKTIKSNFFTSILSLLLFTIICGVFYTVFITSIAQFFFPKQANGSIIEIDGKKYGSELIGQQYMSESHMWGRIMNLDFKTFKTENGESLIYAFPSNLSPASEEYKLLIEERIKMIRASNPDMKDTPIPVDLITCSGSGLDPHISPLAAKYQVPRLAKSNNMSKEDVLSIISKCTEKKFLNIFGEETVNVLKVNLMLDKIL